MRAGHGLVRVVAGLVACVATLTLHATTVRPLGLAELAERAATIFAGRCVDVRDVVDPVLGLAVTEVRFAVDRAAKGAEGGEVVLRMPRGLASDVRFAVGEEVVVFLRAPGAAGLSSPVGLHQGKLAVARDKSGRAVALVPWAAPELARDLGSSDGVTAEAVPVSALLEAVERLVELESTRSGGSGETRP